VSFDETGEPKTGARQVPIPPRLVSELRGWIEARGFGPNDLLFRTRNDRRPAASNWARALKLGCAKADAPSMRVYDCRHAAATTWLRAGAPLGEVARRLGHSVETLVGTYVGALDGDEAITNERIERALVRSDEDAPALGRPHAA
jgi:integrase